MDRKSLEQAVFQAKMRAWHQKGIEMGGDAALWTLYIWEELIEMGIVFDETYVDDEDETHGPVVEDEIVIGKTE